MDRNKVTKAEFFCIGQVALRKESVDRNIMKSISHLGCFRSLSARRAWIEMDGISWHIHGFLQSLSARRAWIEMSGRRQARTSPAVALRKESVDRNITISYSKSKA